MLEAQLQRIEGKRLGQIAREQGFMFSDIKCLSQQVFDEVLAPTNDGISRKILSFRETFAQLTFLPNKQELEIDPSAIGSVQLRHTLEW